jgi:hypothetical protein
VITAPGPLSLLVIEDGIQGAGYSLGADGKFSGTAPSSMTATVSGCGGGSRTVNALVTPSYGAGTYQVLVAMPTATGTGCTLTVTDNLSRSATSPPFKVISSTAAAPVVSNVHNAPGWIHSHSYSVASGPHTRVVNGAGWTESTGVWNPGSALNAYELRSDSTSPCTTAGSGGPSGTSSSITDGNCTWKYLSSVDYLSITAWNFDGPAWVSGTTYSFGDYVTTNVGNHLRSYSLWGSNYNAFCTSTVAPSGVGSSGGDWGLGLLTTGDGCDWQYMADMVYSSQVSYIPFLSYINNNPTNSRATTHMGGTYTATLWNDAEYVAGAAAFSGGAVERNPIMMVDHSQNRVLEGALQTYVFPQTMVVAPGEGFASNLTTGTALSGYDATKGVALRNSNSSPDSPSPSYGAEGNQVGAAGFLAWSDNSGLYGLQIKATNAPAAFLVNAPTADGNIFDGGYLVGGGNPPMCTAVWSDNNINFANNLVLSHGCIGMWAKYGNTFILFNTFVNVGSVTAPVAIGNDWCWCAEVGSNPFQNLRIANNAFYNFTHLYSQSPGSNPSITAVSANNVTNIASPDNTGTTWNQDGTSSTSATVLGLTGVTFSVTGASMFVNPASDYRPNTGLSTAGASFGNYNSGCLNPFTSGCTVENFDTPDILGNARPNGSSQWSVGAEQHP